jgi:hypothetical protein
MMARRMFAILSPGNIDPLAIGDRLLWDHAEGGKTAIYTIDLAKR